MKSKIEVVFFTEKGREISDRIKALDMWEVISWNKEREDLSGFCETAFKEGLPLIFIGATGIAVRTIAPFLKDKLKDPPVVVMDDNGRNIISLVSGHYGGGNELALKLADALEGNPVITTATDVNSAFSVDVFAKEKGLGIKNREGISKVSTKALQGKPITISIKDYPPNELVDVAIDSMPDETIPNETELLTLEGKVDSIIDQGIVAGIGCRRGKDSSSILKKLREALEKIERPIEAVTAIATIDIKGEEEGLKELSKMLGIPIVTFDGRLLSKIRGNFTSSDFVKETVGVDNVCERAALAAVGKNGRLLIGKQAGDGVTVALAEPTSKALKRNTIYVVGMGPGEEKSMTLEARRILDDVDVIVGYTVYLDLLRHKYPNKELISTPMKQEVERCRICFNEAGKGKSVAMVCSGDAGVYGMASIMMEIAPEYTAPDGEGWNIESIPGITAALSGSAVLGAPLNHDFCIISLSDLLTPWEKIEKRLRAAAEGDFAIAIYNPSSKKRKDYLMKACDILMEVMSEDTCCGYVKNIGREGMESKLLTLKELRDEEVDMFTTVFIGNSQTKVIDGRLVTPRGYRI